MKKIALLFVVVMMLAAMSVTSFAANTATFSTVTVDAGTTAATADYTLNFDAGSTVGMIQINLVLPEGITLTGVDQSEFAALADSTVLNDNAFENGQFLVYEDDMTTSVSGALKFTFTFALDSALEAGTYNIGIDESNTLVQTDGGEPMFDSYPGTTITVEAAGPVATEKTVRNAVTVNANDIVKDGVTYQNVAVIDGLITLPTLETGESLTAAGIEYDGDSVKTFTGLTGGGTITYKALFIGIEDAEATALGNLVKTYYTGMFFED